MSITAAQAQQVVDAAIGKAKALGSSARSPSSASAVTVVVVDTAGEIAALSRMDGSGAFNFDIAYGLAYTSAMFSATGEQLDGIKNENWFRAMSTMRGGRIMVAKGALPVRLGDKVIGAIGVSGAPEEVDFEIAEAGIKAI